MLPFFAFRVLLQSVEKIPSVQSLVATSSLPNIWGAVIALGFIFISLWGAPQSVIDFINTWIQHDLPAPLGPNVIIPWRTRWVSYNWINREDQGLKISRMDLLKICYACFFFLTYSMICRTSSYFDNVNIYLKNLNSDWCTGQTFNPLLL